MCTWLRIVHRLAVIASTQIVQALKLHQTLTWVRQNHQEKIAVTNSRKCTESFIFILGLIYSRGSSVHNLALSVSNENKKEQCIQSIQMQTTHSFAVKYPFLWWLCSFAMLTCCGVIFIVISFPANGRIHYSQQFYDFKNSTASRNKVKSSLASAHNSQRTHFSHFYFSVFNSGN